MSDNAHTDIPMLPEERIDPKTRLPRWVVSAGRLMEEGAAVIAEYGVVAERVPGSPDAAYIWMCKLLRRRGKKHGRGSRSKRRYREFWVPLYVIEQAIWWTDTDHPSLSAAVSAAPEFGVQLLKEREPVTILWNAKGRAPNEADASSGS